MTFIQRPMRGGASEISARLSDGALVAVITHPAPASPWHVHHFNRRLKDRCRTYTEARALVLKIYEPILETTPAA
jgi:hypothetical protein